MPLPIEANLKSRTRVATRRVDDASVRLAACTGKLPELFLALSDIGGNRWRDVVVTREEAINRLAAGTAIRVSASNLERSVMIFVDPIS